MGKTHLRPQLSFRNAAGFPGELESSPDPVGLRCISNALEC